MSASLLSLATEICSDFGQDIEAYDAAQTEWGTTEPMRDIDAMRLALALQRAGLVTAKVANATEDGSRVVFDLPPPEAAQ